jgi:hypothetical protein
METKLMLEELGSGTLRDRDNNNGALRPIGSSALMDVALQGRRLQVTLKAPEVNP